MARQKLPPHAPKGFGAKPQKIHNRSDIPDNIVLEKNQQLEKCLDIERQLPSYLSDFFLYLKNAVALSTRLAYLSDILFFCTYLIEYHHDVNADRPADIPEIEFSQITARDINVFLGDYCSRYIIETETTAYVMENHNRALARKRSSLSVLFKFLYRDGFIPVNIAEGFNPIKLPKPQPDAIKRLEIEEVTAMLHCVETGAGLTEKEKQYWEKTRYRDRAILVLFTTYGLRVSELQQLNLSSINYARSEFKIYRKRGKEVNMPLNASALKVIRDYIDLERSHYAGTEADALFLSLQGKRMTVRTIRELAKKYTAIAMQQPRDKGYSPHKLRATAASSLIEYGFSIYDVQNVLDHDNVTTTQLYAAHRKHAKRDILSQYELLSKINSDSDDDSEK